MGYPYFGTLPFITFILSFFYSLYKSLAASKSTFFSVDTRIQFSISLGRIMTLAVCQLAKEYIYSMNTPSSDRQRSTFANEPGMLGQLIPTTSVTLTAK